MKKKKIMKLIIILGVIIIPVMYSFFYLKAFWNPYNNLENMKIAIVNMDKGYNQENLGNELIQKLENKNIMTLDILTNENEAQEGLINEKYYATITIPEKFTQILSNADNIDRKTTTITYSPNQKSNYLASQIINNVTTQIEKELQSEISKKTVGELTNSLQEIPNQLQDVQNATEELENGTTELNKGLKTLNDGSNELNSNYKDFDNGINSAYDGSTELNNAINSLNNGINKVSEGSNELADSTKDLSKIDKGVEELANGTQNLDTSVNKYVNVVNLLTDNITSTQKQIKELSENLQNYASNNPNAMQDTNFQNAMKILKNISNSNGNNTENISAIKTKGRELVKGTEKLNTNMQGFKAKTGNLANMQTGIQTLNTGIIELKEGLSKTKIGSQSLNLGLGELSKNSSKLKSGIKTLASGTNSVLEGETELKNGVTEFKNEINNQKTETEEKVNNLEGLDDYVQKPVVIEEQDYGKVETYGVGFAPYFISISLWVGSLIMLIIFYFDPEDRFKLLGRNANNKILRTLLYALLAMTQGIVLGFLLKIGLGFTVTNIWLYYGTCILIALVFFSIIQFLIINFGDVGKFLSILLLVLQLAASGGTFPIETVPKGFQMIYQYMPMNYTIRLIKEALIQINIETLIKNILVLVTIFIVFILMNEIFTSIKKKKC